MIPRAASFKLLLWALGFAAIGLIDLALPPGIAVWVLYLAPIWFASTPRLMVITACISSALLVLVFATTLPGSFSWGVGLNQFIAVLAIWGFTLVVIRYRRGPRSRGETPGSNEMSGSLSAASSSAEDMRATKWARAALAMAAVLLGYVGLLVFFNLVGEEQTAKWVEHSYQELQYLKDTHSALKDAETGQRGFLLTGEEQYLEPYRTAIATIDRHLRALQRYAVDSPSQQERLRSLLTLITSKLDELRTTIELWRSGQEQEVLRRLRTDVGKHLMDDIRETMDLMEREETAVLTRRTHEKNVATNELVGNLILLTLLAATIGLGAIITIQRESARRRTDAAVRETEQQYRVAFEGAVVGFAQIGLDGRVLLANEQLCSMVDLARADLTAKTIRELIHPSDAGPYLEYTDQLIDRRFSNYGTELRFLRQNGAPFWVHMSLSLVREATDQAPRYFLMVAHNIDERKHAEDALRDSERLLRLAQQAAHAGSWDWNVSTDTFHYSPHYYSLYGLDARTYSPTYDNWLQCVHNEDRARVDHEVTKAVEERHDLHLVFRIVTPDGQVRHMLCLGQPFSEPDGKVVRMTGLSLDVTERIDMQEALAATQERLLLAQKAGDIGTFEWNFDSNEMQWSLAEELLYGLQPGGFGGKYAHWLEAIHLDDRTHTDGMMQRARSGAELNTEFRIVRPDGTVRWIAAKGKTLRDETGSPVSMIGAHIDITERKAAEHRIGKLLEEAGQRERALRDKQDQLIQAAKLVSLGEMATGVAHEINNPLNNISLFAGNILDGLEHGADVTAEGLTGNLKRILQQVKRAAAIVNHLRTFARASSPGHEQVAIDTIVSAAYALMEEQLRLAGIQVTMDLAPGDPQVQGNSIHLEQVFVNLFGNARDALATVPIKQLTIRTAVKPSTVQIFVQDSGNGIDANAHARVFDPFFTTKPVGEGTGLGLSISYGIIKDHGGEISVVSTPGEGATFVIELPLLSPSSH